MLPSTVTPSEFWWIGVLLDMIATLAGTIGKQLLRYAVLTKEMRYYPLGLFFTAVVDPVFDLSAYSFAAQSIIAPCAGMVVVWNVLLAPYTLQEKLTASRLIGAVLVCIGTVIMGLCGNHDEVDRTVAEYIALFSRPAAIIYYALFTLYCSAMTYVILRKGRFASSFAQVALGGSFAGNMFTTKAVVEMADCFRDYDRTAEEIEGCSPNPFLGPTPYLFASVSLALACISLWLLAVGLRDFEALYMITVFEGFMIIFGALSGTAALSTRGWPQLGRRGAPCGLLYHPFLSPSPQRPLAQWPRCACARTPSATTCPVFPWPHRVHSPQSAGLVVMGEGEGQGLLRLTGYSFGIGLILSGLIILCRGEPAFKERNSGERAALTSPSSSAGGTPQK